MMPRIQECTWCGREIVYRDGWKPGWIHTLYSAAVCYSDRFDLNAHVATPEYVITELPNRDA